MDNLEKFARDLVAEKLTPYLKSEPVPDKDDGPVKVRLPVTRVCVSRSALGLSNRHRF